MLVRMDDLIYRGSSGTPKAFADRLGISERYLYKVLNYLKTEHNVLIRYNIQRQTYEYEEPNRRFIIGWKKVKMYAEIQNE